MANWQTIARRAAQRWGLDPEVFVRQMGLEAHGQDLTSPAGAQGPAQIMPATARAWGVRNVHDINEAYDAAAKHMAGYVHQFGSVKDALVAYNAGPGAVGKPLPGETRNYVSSILGGRVPTVRTTTTPARSVSAPAPGGELPGRGALIASFLEDKHSDPLDFALSVRALARQQPQVRPVATAPSLAPSGPSGGGKVFELFYDPAGFRSPGNDHYDHVHVAAPRNELPEIQQLAKQMGLHVTSGARTPAQNAAAGGSPTSYHLKGEADDFGGSPRDMAAFAKLVARRYKR